MSKQRYDHIVVGSGISGLTVALLLAQQQRKVLLLETSPRLGGAVARFQRDNVPFDVGFHFTGGLGEDGTSMFDDMLRILGLREAIHPVFTDGVCHRIAVPETGMTYEIPPGIDRYREKLKADFGRYKSEIDAYFDRMYAVCERTTTMNAWGMTEGQPQALDEDFITLQQVLDEMFPGPLIKLLLSAFCMCHGSRPDEISFASHVRAAFALYQSTARIEGGGDALLNAFECGFQETDIEIRCNTSIQCLEDIRNRRVERFVLTDGDAVTADSCIFTIHPHSILELLPLEHISRAFQHRVRDFEPSTGFFSIFGTLDETVPLSSEDAIFSVFPGLDMNQMMSPEWTGSRPLVMLCYDENVQNKHIKTLTAFECAHVKEVEPWQDTRTGRRGEAYTRYKAEKFQSIMSRLSDYFPEMKRGFKCLDTASMLTFRDYLNTPYGSAYGIKQKVGQFNLVGRLPLLNLYAAGQSAVLPGVVGAMASAFFVSRALLGRQAFQEIIEEKLCIRGVL